MNKKNKSFNSSIYAAFVDNENALKRFLGRFLYKSQDVEDMAQETFLRAYKATQGHEIESPRAYLFKVARTMAYKELSRSSRRLTDYLEDLERAPDAGAQLEEEVVAQQQIQIYCDAIAELPSRCRRIFLMRKVQAKSYKVIARELGISVSAVEKQVAIGADRCKRLVQSREQAGVPRQSVKFIEQSKKGAE
ncbi:MAG: RNA polymerase sigma factor [Pseudomonadales bacterium]|mgnify:FL=1|jgi:RNA polymerase sigma factor (sigma-70 family)|tara:strand:+ start:739 stop:1314 length:576 start_codon:yes stop_codon:yes gene_type:complete